MTRDKRFVLRWVVSVLAVMFLAGGASWAGAEDKVRFILDWVPYGKHAPFYAGQARGIYKSYGVDMEIVAGKGSGLAVKTVAGQGVDYGFADAGTLILARANNPDLGVKLIAMVHHDAMFNILTLEKSGIKSPKELEGKKVGTAPSAAPKIVFPALAPFTGLDPSKITWVEMNPAVHDQSLFSEKIDALLSYTTRNPTVFKMAKEFNKPVRSFNYADYGLNMYSNGIIAHENTLKTKANLTRRFIIATLESMKWAVEHPDEAVGDFLTKNPTVSRDLARGHWDVAVDVLLTKNTRGTGIGFMRRDKMQQTIDIMFEYNKKDMKRKPLPEEVYTNDFVAVFPHR